MFKRQWKCLLSHLAACYYWVLKEIGTVVGGSNWHLSLLFLVRFPTSEVPIESTTQEILFTTTKTQNECGWVIVAAMMITHSNHRMVDLLR